jgi:signal transduction protein with GAF and PtsI domain
MLTTLRRILHEVESAEDFHFDESQAAFLVTLAAQLATMIAPMPATGSATYTGSLAPQVLVGTGHDTVSFRISARARWIR